jgi:MFS family permease
LCFRLLPIVVPLYVVELLGRRQIAWASAGALAVVGIGLLSFAVRHLKRSAHPMVDLSALGVPTFAATVWGGSLFRMGVSAIPFLLPVMFQIGFGYDAFDAGLMMMTVFAGNLIMKPMTTSVLRRFGFRSVLVVNGLINAAAIAACAAIAKHMPLPVICAILFVGGMSRSMQFTALNAVAFADIPQKAMAAANTLFSIAFQLAMGLGVALGAIAWRIGELAVSPGDSATLPFRIAFLLVAAVALIGVWDSMMLHATAGEHVAKRALSRQMSTVDFGVEFGRAGRQFASKNSRAPARPDARAGRASDGHVNP